MSRRSQILQQRAALQRAPRPAAAMGQPQQLGIEQLVPMLIAAGAKPGYLLQVNMPDKIVRLVARCGALQIPLDFKHDEALDLVQHLCEAAERVQPAEAEDDEPVPTSPAGEELLAQSVKTVEELSRPNGSVIVLPS